MTKYLNNMERNNVLRRSLPQKAVAFWECETHKCVMNIVELLVSLAMPVYDVLIN